MHRVENRIANLRQLIFQALTGVDKNIWEMTPSEISNLTYKKTLVYGKFFNIWCFVSRSS